MANWYLPDVILNPGKTILDVYDAYPWGLFSLWGMAPTGSKEAQVKAVSSFIPAKVTTTIGGKPKEQTFKEFTSSWVTQSKKTTTTSKTFWTEDTKPELFPGFDLIGEYGKYIPLIIIGVVAIWLLPKIFKEK